MLVYWDYRFILIEWYLTSAFPQIDGKGTTKNAHMQVNSTIFLK